MRTTKILSGFLACMLCSATAMAEETALPVPQDLQQKMNDTVSSAKDAVNSAVPAMPTLPGSAPVVNDPAKKAEAASLSAPPPIALAPAATIPALPATTAAPTLTPAAPVKKESSANFALPPVSGESLAIPTAAPSTETVKAAAPSAVLALPTPDTSAANPARVSDTPPALPTDTSSMLPNMGGAPAPALPFAVPDAAKPATETPVTGEAKILTNTGDVTAAAPIVTPAADANAAPKKTGKHHHMLASNGKVRYHNIRMPATIYKKKYNHANKDLPVAYYETDMDKLLFIATKRDDLSGMHAILDFSKRSVNLRNARGETPLIVAAKNNAYNAVRMLIGRHADISATDASGMTALQAAQNAGNMRIVNILTTMGGDRQQMATAGTIAGTPVTLMKHKHVDVD